MVIPPPFKPDRVTKFLKPYVLKMHFTNEYVTAQVIHTPTATVASSVSTQEKALRLCMQEGKEITRDSSFVSTQEKKALRLSMQEGKESTRDVAAARKIGKLLGERLLLKNIPVISVFLKKDQKYHGKVKAVIDSVREAGVKLI